MPTFSLWITSVVLLCVCVCVEGLCLPETVCEVKLMSVSPRHPPTAQWVVIGGS